MKSEALQKHSIRWLKSLQKEEDKINISVLTAHDLNTMTIYEDTCMKLMTDGNSGLPRKGLENIGGRD